MDEPEFQRPEDFDLDGDFSQGDTDIDDIFDQMGWEDWRDVIANVDFLDGFEVRPGHYFSPQDAIKEAYERGIAEYISLYYDGEAWYLVVSYDEPE